MIYVHILTGVILALIFIVSIFLTFMLYKLLDAKNSKVLLVVCFAAWFGIFQTLVGISVVLLGELL